MGKPLKHSSKRPLLVWEFQRSKVQRKQTYVNLRVGSRLVYLDKVRLKPEVLSRHQYKTHDIPAEALTACAGGDSERVYRAYVLQDGDSMYVYKYYYSNKEIRQSNTLLKARLLDRWHIRKPSRR